MDNKIKSRILGINANKVALVLIFVLAVSLFCVIPAYADAADNIISNVNSGTDAIMRIIKAIATPIAVVYIAIQAFKIFFGDRNAVDGAKKGILLAVLALAIIYLAKPIVETIISWVNN